VFDSSKPQNPKTPKPREMELVFVKTACEDYYYFEAQTSHWRVDSFICN
jgi:hypothetical protein